MKKVNKEVNRDKSTARTIREAEQLATVLLSLPMVRKYRRAQTRKAKTQIRRAA